jgi:hypothetical protein
MTNVNCLTLSDYLCKKTLRKRRRQAIYEAFGHKCAYCGGKVESLDHILPKIRGGGETFNNLAASCLRCNGLKGHQDVWEFFESQPFYCHKRAAFLKVWMRAESYLGLLPLPIKELPPDFFVAS